MSIALAGSGQYLTRASLVAAGDNFTAMIWAFPTSNPASNNYHNAFATGTVGGAGTFGFGITTHNAGGTTRWSVGTNSNDFDGSTVVLNTWNHVALIRDTGTE
jgi:hypothetical protein